MNKVRLWWHDYRYFSYERDLARREIATMIGGASEEIDGGLSVTLPAEATKTLAGLTYFKGIQSDTEMLVPDQARLEATANGHGQEGRSDTIPTLKRQSTRYSAHGLHEYRGKFNPQVVRAIGNILKLEKGAWLLDPFCGSGTTLLEAAHIGWNCVGLEINPLGVLIANAKVTAFRTAPEVLQETTGFLICQLENLTKVGERWEKVLPDAEYLAKWFTAPVLSQLAFIIDKIESVRLAELRDVFRVILSDLCRNVSLQDPSDLRIRRRKNPAEIDTRVIEAFISALRGKVDTILRARKCIPVVKAHQAALLSDARTNEDARKFLSQYGRRMFTAAITSPPYATALPYVDTQRLSLCLLGLVRSTDIRKLERILIGNREISGAERLKLEEMINANTANLPDEILTFCRRLSQTAQHSEHGFRKRNVPALVYNYFRQMAKMFTSVRAIIKPGGTYALLVGSNRTTLRGEEVLIDTPRLLASLAESRGWSVAETIPFETYQRFDVHQKNSIRSELLLVLRNKKQS